ncbi:MAG TPA: tetratricopeptide repeat protein [Casimicrobiaceae bacterium]|nr:tetratricopeptide repeat protein [Casimicrobiaceae bacterium]
MQATKARLTWMGMTAAFAFVAAPSALAQGAKSVDAPAPALPPEYTDDARRAYARGLGEARKLIEAKRYDEAIERLSALSKERPREAQARFLKAVVESDSGRTQDAVVTLRALLADFPELPEPRNNLAVLHAAQGNYLLARQELELAIAAAPDYAVARENLGDVYARLALAEYERAQALDKTSKTVAPKLKLARELLGVSAR